MRPSLVLAASLALWALALRPARADLFGRISERDVFDQPLSGRIARVSFPSEALGESRTLYVYTPPGYQPRENRTYPVIVLLHGTPGGALDWPGRGDAARTLDQAIVSGRFPAAILVFPDGHGPYWRGGSEWADDVAGRCRMATAIGKDLPRFLKERYRLSPNPEDWTLGGLSEGGYGAANLVLQYPHAYRNALVFSGDLRVQDSWGDAEQVFGSDPAYRAANSPAESIRHAAPELRRALRFYLAVGADDDIDLQSQAAAFAALWRSQGGTAQFVRDPGKHNWNFWKAQFADALTPLARWLAEPRR